MPVVLNVQSVLWPCACMPADGCGRSEVLKSLPLASTTRKTIPDVLHATSVIQ